jgi:hypothetical protein
MTKDEQIIDIIREAIWEGAREWDPYAIPQTEAPAQKALQRIKEVGDDDQRN